MPLEFQSRRRHRPPKLEPAVELGGVPDDATAPTETCNVLVTSGIHRGHFPIGGMRVRDARQVLQRLIGIDESAVAVIDGRAVEEDEVITEHIAHVAFVKPSAIKGVL